MGVLGIPDDVVNVLDPGGFHKDDDKLAKDRAAMAEKLYGGIDQSGNLYGTAGDARRFGQQGAAGFAQGGAQLAEQARFLRGQTRGENSISAEQLRQGLQQNVAGQQAMAASARPSNSAMAARTASMNAGRSASGMAGQQAVAGLAERQQAQQALANLTLQQRQQNLQATMGGQQNALSGYGNIEQAGTSRYGALLGVQMPNSTGADRFMGAAGSAAGAIGAAYGSDKRLKKDVEPADDDADALLKGLRAFRYRYKDEKFGKGKQLGIMAQDLERAGAKHVVIDTPEGKMVHGAKLAGALAATLPGLDKRLSKLEKGG